MIAAYDFVRCPDAKSALLDIVLMVNEPERSIKSEESNNAKKSIT